MKKRVRKPKEPTKKEPPQTEDRRIAKVPVPTVSVDYEFWRKEISGKLPDLTFPAEVGLSVLAQILILDITNPFALILVDVPSSGKTMTINFFSNIKELTYTTDKFNPASIVSSAANRTKDALKDIDMLPRIKHKLFLIRDLGPMFSFKDDHLKELLGLMTRLLDGEGLVVDSGTHGRRGYEGENLFMLLGAVTPLEPKIWKTMSQLGSRLFFLHMKGKDKSEAELAGQLIRTTVQSDVRFCAMATRQFLYTLWHKHKNGILWKKESDDKEAVNAIARCSMLLAKLRGHISVWKDWNSDDIDHTEPIIERPDRINQLLYNLARGHAVIRGHKSIDFTDILPVIEVTIDSAPTNRSRIVRQLLINGGRIRTSEIEKVLRCTHPTAIKEMQTLEVLGVGHVHQGGLGEVGGQEKWFELSDNHNWFASEEFQKVWQGDSTQPPIPFHDSPNRESKTTPVSGEAEVSGLSEKNQLIKSSDPGSSPSQ